MGFPGEKQIKTLPSHLGSFLRLLPSSRGLASQAKEGVIDPALNTYTYHAAMILLATFFHLSLLYSFHKTDRERERKRNGETVKQSGSLLALETTKVLDRRFSRWRTKFRPRLMIISFLETETSPLYDKLGLFVSIILVPIFIASGIVMLTKIIAIMVKW